MTGIMIGAFISACTVDVKQISPPVRLPHHFSKTGTQHRPQQWWTVFNDPHLNQLIDQALRHNFSLLSAFNRVEHATALVKKTGALQTPSINLQVNASRNITDKLSTQGFSLGLMSHYEVDLWGRIRANVQAAELDLYAQAEDLKTATIALSAEIAHAWYRLIEYRQLLTLFTKQIKINRHHLDILILRFNATQATAADVFQQQQLLERIEGEKVTIIANIQMIEHQLAVLLGQPPADIILPFTRQFPELPALPQTGLVLDLIQRRPDLRQAYFQVQAADQRIAAAIADRFPKISLSASINSSAPNLQSLLNNWLATLAGNLLLPLIDGHQRIAEVERQQALAKSALNQYAHQLLIAVQEIENALIQHQQQQKLVSSLEKQYQLARQANEQIKLRYQNGAESFLRFLSSILSQQELERHQIQQQRQFIDYHINLYRALSGSLPVSTRRE